MLKARRATLEVTYNNKDISLDITKDLKSFTYTDNESSTADDIDITLHNRHGLWTNDWYPDLPAKLTAKILYKDAGRVSFLDCGVFELDQFDAAFGSESTVSFKGASVPQNNTVRRTAKNRAWEGVKLSEIATDVAKTGGLNLTYVTNEDPVFSRVEQNNKSDLAFLQSLCEDYALSIKITKEQIVIFDRDDLELKDIIATIVNGENDSTTVNFSNQIHDTYSEATVKYKDPKTGKTTEVTEKAEGKKGGKQIQETKRVENAEQAKKLAAAKLKNKNRFEITGQITMIGDSRYVAGATIELIGYGEFSGKYYIDKVTHSVGSGYTISLDISSVNNEKEDKT